MQPIKHAAMTLYLGGSGKSAHCRLDACAMANAVALSLQMSQAGL